MKLLLKTDRRYSTNYLHRDLNILKIQDIYEVCLLRFVHSCVRGEPIETYQNFFTSHVTVHTYNTRHKDRLKIHQIRTELGKSTTHYSGASLWNNLPKNITDIRYKDHFKRSVSALYKAGYNDS